MLPAPETYDALTSTRVLRDKTGAIDAVGVKESEAAFDARFDRKGASSTISTRLGRLCVWTIFDLAEAPDGSMATVSVLVDGPPYPQCHCVTFTNGDAMTKLPPCAISVQLDRFDVDGKPRWRKRVGAASFGNVPTLTIDPVGRLFVHGLIDGHESVVAYDPTGKRLWNHAIGAPQPGVGPIASNGKDVVVAAFPTYVRFEKRDLERQDLVWLSVDDGGERKRLELHDVELARLTFANDETTLLASARYAQGGAAVWTARIDAPGSIVETRDVLADDAARVDLSKLFSP